MEFIVQTLYWVSSGLLIPTIVLLLLFLAQGLMVGGSFYGIYANRMAFEKSIRGSLDELDSSNYVVLVAPDKIRKAGLVNTYLAKLLAVRDNPVRSEKKQPQ